MSITLDEFAQMVSQHDLTFQYSDDNYMWERGRKELADIRAFAEFLPRADVVRIWNAEVDRKMAEGYRDQFYWK